VSRSINLTYFDYQQDIFFEWKPGIKYKIVPKGRRGGITKGGANAIIELLLDKEGPILWGDTIHANIKKYFERYFEPEMKAQGIRYKWEQQEKQLTIGNQYCDFRSADNPENWEGFGYKYIFLNEAGIILKNKELYVNTVLPMLLDYPDSRLIAAGVPKGKMLKDGSEHPFYSLHKRAEASPDKYESITITSYNNPLLSIQDIKDLEAEMAELSPSAIRQEIYGEFIEVDAINPFAEHYDPDFHESELAIFRRDKPLYISVDFNRYPFAVTFWHHWQDHNGDHFHGIDEAEIQNGNVPAMIDLIKMRYSGQLHSCVLTGDAMGKRGEMALRDNSSHYQSMQRELGLNRSQVQVPANPTHQNSKDDVNWILYHSKQPATRIHFYLNPTKMPNTCRDFRLVQCDAFGQILKGKRTDVNQRADYLDTGRYFLNLAAKPIIRRMQK
jgi:hypothetical protein